MIFEMSPGLNELKDPPGKALHWQILLTLTECNTIEIYYGYFHLEFMHVTVNKSRNSFKVFIVNQFR